MATNRLRPINLRLPELLITESDRLAETIGSSRSELVRTALRSYIDRQRKLAITYALVEKRGKEVGINSPEDIERVLTEVRAAHQGK